MWTAPLLVDKYILPDDDDDGGMRVEKKECMDMTNDQILYIFKEKDPLTSVVTDFQEAETCKFRYNLPTLYTALFSGLFVAMASSGGERVNCSKWLPQFPPYSL